MTKTGQRAEKHIKKTKLFFSDLSVNIQDKYILILCALSLFAEFADISLCAISLVYIQTCKKRTGKYICSFMAVAYFLSTINHTAYYIPYITFIFVYIIADYLLENYSLRAVYPAVCIFAVTKGYMLSFGYETVYWLYFAAEIIFVIYGPQAMITGWDILKNNEDCQSGQNLAEILCTLTVTAMSLDGVNIWGVNLSTAFLLGCGCFYGSKYNFTLSFSAVFAMIITLCQHNSFHILLAGFGAIYISGIFFIPKGIKGYIYYVITSIAVSVLSISHFNSLVFISSTAFSAIVCFGTEKLTQPVCHISVRDNMTGEKDYYTLKNKLEKLNRCFRFLGQTVIDISELIAKEYVADELETAVANEVCRKCKNNAICWQQKYSDTQKQFSSYAHNLQKNSCKDFDSWFYERCNKTEQLKQSFEQHNRLQLTQRLIYSQGLNNQKILQNQFLTMASVLQEINYQSNLSGVANAAFTHKANSFLHQMGKRVNYCICYQNRNRCIVSTTDVFSEGEIHSFKSRLEIMYSSKFKLLSKETEGNNTIYAFAQEPMFSCEFATKSMSLFKNCGDVSEYFFADEFAYIIIADGMGTGSFAAAEAKTVMVMLKNLLSASVKVETSLEIVNTALNLKGTGQSCVAVDILRINLYDGSSNLYKAGGTVTYIIDGKKQEALYKDSLPVGILKDIKLAQFSFILNNGDTVIMSSDGVKLQEKDISKLRLIKDKCSSKSIAEYIVKNTDTSDDATANVVKLIRT